MKELVDIQVKLKAPKSQRNAFGQYMYRSCEDILEAVKPLLNENRCSITVSDEVALIGDRFYVKATATLTNSAGETASAVGYAREPLMKKGCDDSQITGASSSYARKYALNGLLAIDDSLDSDTTNTGDTKEVDYKKLVMQCKAAIKKASDLNKLTAIYNEFTPKLNDEDKQTITSLLSEKRKLVEK